MMNGIHSKRNYYFNTDVSGSDFNKGRSILTSYSRRFTFATYDNNAGGINTNDIRAYFPKNSFWNKTEWFNASGWLNSYYCFHSINNKSAAQQHYNEGHKIDCWYCIPGYYVSGVGLLANSLLNTVCIDLFNTDNKLVTDYIWTQYPDLKFPDTPLINGKCSPKLANAGFYMSGGDYNYQMICPPSLREFIGKITIKE